MSKRPALDANTLAQFTGSEQFYRHPLVRSFVFTEGVKYVADAAGAYWLLDEIALANRFEIAVRADDFQVWDLLVEGDGSARLICGNGNAHDVYVKSIDWTDFPEPGIRLFCANSTIHLPSEY